MSIDGFVWKNCDSFVQQIGEKYFWKFFELYGSIYM